MNESILWWLRYLRLFALNSPWGTPVKFTIGVNPLDGREVAALWKQKPKNVVDAYGRPCLQVETEDHLIAIEWLVPPPSPPPSKNPVTWGGKSSADPPRRPRNEK